MSSPPEPSFALQLAQRVSGYQGGRQRAGERAALAYFDNATRAFANGAHIYSVMPPALDAETRRQLFDSLATCGFVEAKNTLGWCLMRDGKD